MKYIVETNKVTLTTLTHYLNAHMQKKTGVPFTVSDVQGYIKRGRLPLYLGHYKIILLNEIKGVKLYTVKKGIHEKSIH